MIVPSLQTCCCRFLCASPCSHGLPTHIRESAHCRHPGWAMLPSQWNRGSGEKGRGEAEAGSSCDMCLFLEIQLLSSCSLTCCLLLIIILFLYLSLQKHAHLLLLHGNHLLVSLSCSAASVIHNIPPTPPLSPTLGWMQHSNRAVLLLFSHYPSISSPPWLTWLRYNLLPQNVTGIPQLRQVEECCLSLLLASKCCCKVFLVQRSSILNLLQRYIYNLLIGAIFSGQIKEPFAVFYQALQTWWSRGAWGGV